MMQQLQTWIHPSNFDSETILAAAAIVAAAWVLIVLVNRLLRRVSWRVAQRLHMSYEASLTIARGVTGIVWIVAAMALLNLWGVNLAGLWTVLISGAAVIGVGFLAVWTMVSNITASLFLTFWRPFHLGATVELLPENLKGRVIDRNMMFTAVRDEAGNILQIPNNLFFQKVFRVSDTKIRSVFELLEASGRKPAQVQMRAPVTEGRQR
jgi:small-conductance mechanosensitive channel